MPLESSVNDVFRFIQLRPKRSGDETPTVPLIADTPLAQALLGAQAPAQRMARANAELKAHKDTVRSVDDVAFGPAVLNALAALRDQPEATTETLAGELRDLDTGSKFDDGRRLLSNTLLATFYASESFPRDIRRLQDVYRVAAALARRRDEKESVPVPLAELLAMPILAPVPGGAREAELRSNAIPADAAEADAGLAEAIAELARLDRSDLLVQPDENGMEVPGKGKPFTLTAAARERVSAPTISLLQKHGVDLASMPIDVAVHSLVVDRPPKRIKWPRPVVTTQPGITLPPAPAHALVRPAGIADLLVVKQQIKRYEAGEIAHVENVLIGETKSRAHRQLERSEETFVTETEVTRERETELETADRFELNREMSRTVREDQQIGLGLSLSGKYGPTVEFSSNFEMDLATSSEETTRSSSRYARDVVSRSLERITERVREVRSRTLIRETEETNLHELKNETGAHVRGIYQFIDKVYEAQIFNYGLREMFDFIVPEPASFLWYMEQNPSLDIKLPPPVPKLELVAADASDIDEGNALELAATYGASGVEIPPPLYKLLVTGVKHGEDNASESGRPHSVQRVEVQVPSGYRLLRARIGGLAFTDDRPVIAVAIGNQRALWAPTPSNTLDLSGGNALAHRPEVFLSLGSEPHELSAESKLGVSILAWEANTYSIEVVIVAQRTEEELARWRVATYNRIRAAYDERVRQYEQRVEELRAEAEARAERESRRPFGAPPAENKRTILTELKKHCISIITQQRYDAFDATKDGTPPFFDFDEGAAEGAYIRFFEQAFEWDQMQYVFYPYFWARKTTWIDRLSRQDVDPQYTDFLRAGAARVVVPVRPGFETAITHFIETGAMWGGDGEPPQISSPLYVSIIDEIRERTGAPQGEIPVGDPWDARVPTALVLVRDGGDLPRWERTVPGEWSWQPVPAGS